MSIKITGTGSYIPSVIEQNQDFINHSFLNNDGISFEHSNDVIIKKFQAITGIGERRYAKNHLNSSDLAFFAAEKAIQDAKIDPEKLDYIIIAHNFGDVKHGTVQSDLVPSLAARVKHQLRIKNPNCVAYDILFGCPGWIEALIQAKAFIESGMAKKCLVVGTETLSRVVDKHDRDSMIYSDGAGAAVVEASEEEGGIIATKTASFTYDEAYFLYFGSSFNKESCRNTAYIKMHGRKIYEFAVTQVPQAIKDCLVKSGEPIENLKKIFIHQANEKMDEAIIKRFYKLYNMDAPEGIMPMNIHKLGNSSVATVPTLFDMVRKGNMNDHELNKGDVIIFASVGAGMNINAVVYKC
ncbi:ketoacyl-ACP synthase III [Flavobacteriaceae bacterium R38]|nr:ketoacyl-ACP synthase III [Flavobacteriaceae bacterium R38]